MKKYITLLLALFLSSHLMAQAAPTKATVGGSVTITVNAGTGTPPFIWTYFKNDVKWTPPVAPVISADGKTAVVKIANAQLTDAGTYLVNVYNSEGNTNTPTASVTVAQLIIMPGNATINITAEPPPAK